MSSLSVSDNGDGVPPTCCVALRPKIILRNLIVPEEMWSEFPSGLGYSITDYFLYQPGFKCDRATVTSPEKYKLPYEEVWIHTKDNVKLHAFLIRQQQLSSSNLPTIIFFHGNAGNIGDRLENVKLVHDKVRCNFLLVEYRGYGFSEGIPSEKGLYRDAKAAFDFVLGRKDLDSAKIFLFGRSLGGAVAIDLASRKKYRDHVAGLIVENTFTNIPDLARSLFPYKALKWVPNFCFKNRYDSLSKMNAVKCPTALIRGLMDDMMPENMMTDLYDKCSVPCKKMIPFEEAGHNDTYESDGYAEKLDEFISKALALAANEKSTPSPANSSS